MFQRGELNTADVTLRGLWNAVANDTIAGIRVSEDGVNWTTLENFSLNTTEKTFSGLINGLTTGWHEFQIEAFDADGSTLTTTSEKVGVGDLFITSGDANAANYGAKINRLAGENVYALDVSTGEWQLANDQQPGASTLLGGTSGSVWGKFGESLASLLGEGVPIGIVSTAQANTDVTSWDPFTAGSNYERLKAAIEALDGDFTAVLWDAGRTDHKNGINAETYRETMLRIIDAAYGLTDADDWSWVMATETFSEGTTDADLLAAQNAVIASRESVVAGPNLDAFAALLDENGFLTEVGLTQLANAWVYAVGTQVFNLPEPGTWSLLALGAFLLFASARRSLRRH